MILLQKNIIMKKQKQLKALKIKSNKALDIVTSTISSLSLVNDKIDNTISEIVEAKLQLSDTEEDLNKTKRNNINIINKFKALIEDKD
jgi:hypothetical protein